MSNIDKNTTLQRKANFSFDVFYEDNTSPAPIDPVPLRVVVGNIGQDQTDTNSLTVNEWTTMSAEVTLANATVPSIKIGSGSANDLPQAGG